MPRIYKRGSDNPGWKGDDATYGTIHRAIRRRYPVMGRCSRCGTTEGVCLANKDHKYRRHVEDWIELCYRCHQKHDQEAGLRPLVTECPKGHPYDEENTCFTKAGRRACRACARDRYHRRKQLRGYPVNPCKGCGCPPDLRTPGCPTCTTRHWARKKKRTA